MPVVEINYQIVALAVQSLCFVMHYAYTKHWLNQMR
jgi:hypothetical protein